jgi:hypothetical protein
MSSDSEARPVKIKQQEELLLPGQPASGQSACEDISSVWNSKDAGATSGEQVCQRQLLQPKYPACSPPEPRGGPSGQVTNNISDNYYKKQVSVCD